MIASNADKLLAVRQSRYHSSILSSDIQAYNRSKVGENRAICERLFQLVDRAMPKAERKIWYGSPVWFDNGNPLVGYHVLKNCVRLLFWSGQSFDEPGLRPGGSFKAAEARYTEAGQINADDVARWLEKSKHIQWDYKNIVKRRGALARLK